MSFKPEIYLKKYRFKGFSKDGVKFEADISVKNNFFLSVILKDLSADLNLIDRKIKILSDDKIGMFFLSEGFKDLKLKYKVPSVVKLSLIIYYGGIFLSLIPNVLFLSRLNYEACVEVYFKILFKKIKMPFVKRGNVFKLLKGKIFTL